MKGLNKDLDRYYYVSAKLSITDLYHLSLQHNCGHSGNCSVVHIDLHYF